MSGGEVLRQLLDEAMTPGDHHLAFRQERDVNGQAWFDGEPAQWLADVGPSLFTEIRRSLDGSP